MTVGPAMSWMLDTNTVSHILKGNPQALENLSRAPMANVCISVITEGELRFSIAKRLRGEPELSLPQPMARGSFPTVQRSGRKRPRRAGRIGPGFMKRMKLKYPPSITAWSAAPALIRARRFSCVAATRSLSAFNVTARFDRRQLCRSHCARGARRRRPR